MPSSSPQNSTPPVESPDAADAWIDRLSQAFEDGNRKSGFLDIAEAAIGACPGDPSILMLAAMAALFDQRPERALTFLKRLSKRYVTTDVHHLLQALALFQSTSASWPAPCWNAID